MINMEVPATWDSLKTWPSCGPWSSTGWMGPLRRRQLSVRCRKVVPRQGVVWMASLYSVTSQTSKHTPCTLC